MKRAILVILLVATLMITIPNTSAEMKQYQNEDWGKSKHHDSAGTNPPGIYHWEAGDNITITMTNYTGDNIGTIWIEAWFNLHHEKGGQWDTSGHCVASAVPLMSDDVISCWVIVSFEGYKEDIVSKSTEVAQYDWNLTRTKTKYSVDYAYQEDIAALQDQIDIMNTNITSLNDAVSTLNDTLTEAVDDIKDLEYYLNELDAGLILFRTNISQLWNAYSALNDSLTGVMDDIYDDRDKNEKDKEKMRKNMTYIQENLTAIEDEIVIMQAALDGMADLNETELKEMQDGLDDAISDLQTLAGNISAIEQGMPDPYNDTTLAGRINALETENGLLRQEIDALETKMDDMENEEGGEIEEGGTDWMFPLVLIVAILAFIVAVMALTRKPSVEGKVLADGNAYQSPGDRKAVKKKAVRKEEEEDEEEDEDMDDEVDGVYQSPGDRKAVKRRNVVRDEYADEDGEDGDDEEEDDYRSPGDRKTVKMKSDEDEEDD